MNPLAGISTQLPAAAARCGYRTSPRGNSGLAQFTEIVLFVGKGFSGYHAGDEMECRVTEDGHITLTAIKPPEGPSMTDDSLADDNPLLSTTTHSVADGPS